MSAQGLADRCAELGHPIQRDVISNLENGRRATVPVTDLIVIAEALGVPALSLVFNPDAAGNRSLRTPLQPATVWECFEEFAGLRPMRHIATPTFETWSKVDHLRELADFEDAAVEHVSMAKAVEEVREEQSALRSTRQGTYSHEDPNLDPLESESDQDYKAQVEFWEESAARALRGAFRTRQRLAASGVELWPVPEVLLSRYKRTQAEVTAEKAENRRK